MATFKSKNLNSSKTFTITPVVHNCSACDDQFYQNSSPDNILKLHKLFLDTINIDIETNSNNNYNHHNSLTELIFCPNCISKLNELDNMLRKLENLKDRIQNTKDYINATVTNTSFRLKYGIDNSRQSTTSKEIMSSSSSTSCTSFIFQIREKVMQNWISNGQTRNVKSSSLVNRRNGNRESSHMLSKQSQNSQQLHDSIDSIPNNSTISNLSKESTTTTSTYENLDIFNTQINDQEAQEEEEEEGGGEELVVGMRSNISDKRDIIPTQLLLIQDEDDEQNSSDESRSQIKIEPGSLRSLSSSSSNINSNCNMRILERHITSENITDTRNIHDNYCPPSDEMSSLHHDNHHIDIDTNENSCVVIPGSTISSTYNMFYDENTDFTSNNNHDSFSNGLHCDDRGTVNEEHEHNEMYSMVDNVDNPSHHNNDGFFSQDSQRHVPLTDGESSLALVPSSSTQQKSYKMPITRLPKQRLNGAHQQFHVEMCPLCYKYILSGNQLEHICEGKSTTSRYQCGYCASAVFFSERVLIDHVSRHLETQLMIPSSASGPSTSSSTTFVMFSCKLCKRKFSSTTGLTAHMKSSHHSSSIARCRSRSTTSSQQYGHSMTTNLKTVSIDKSGKKKLKSKSSLENRPFRCSFCHKGFRLRNDLRRHSMIHTGERPYNCMYCSKSFNRSHHLKTHIEVHRKRKEI